MLEETTTTTTTKTTAATAATTQQTSQVATKLSPTTNIKFALQKNKRDERSTEAKISVEDLMQHSCFHDNATLSLVSETLWSTAELTMLRIATS